MISLKGRKETYNFYESFSDLIFNTLVLFLFMILGLVVNVNKRTEALSRDEIKVAQALKDSEQRLEELRRSEVALRDRRKALDKEAEELQGAVDEQKRRSRSLDDEIKQKQADLRETINEQEEKIAEAARKIHDLEGTNRFTGTSGGAFLAVVCVPDGPRSRIYFVPGNASEEYALNIIGETEAEKASRMESILQSVFSAVDSQRGLTVAECQQLLSSISWFRGAGGEKLRVRVTMRFSQECAEHLGRPYSDAEAIEMLVKLRIEPADASIKQAPTVGVAVGEKQGDLPVGKGVVFTPEELVCFLNASSGTKLAIELTTPEEGKIPDWFLDSVMRPTGYLNRMPNLPPAGR